MRNRKREKSENFRFEMQSVSRKWMICIVIDIVGGVGIVGTCGVMLLMVLEQRIYKELTVDQLLKDYPRKLLAQKLRGDLDTRPESCPVEKFYIYWTVSGRRFDEALLANAAKLETMRSLWMSNCSVSFEACKLLAQKLPGFNVEVIDEGGHPDTRPESCPNEKLHIYRKVSGRRNLRELDLGESEVEDLSGHWLSHFPDSCSSLVSLNIACLASEVRFSALERLVSHSPHLRTLQLNRAVSIEKLPKLLLMLLSWLNLVLDLTLLTHRLMFLKVLDYVEDSGLEEIANSCKELQELRVFPSDPFALGPNISLTEQGLVAISVGCLKLQSVLYFCRQDK
ncbi:Protein TRANSPORT INHIBITOR RESPONSE 1 [Capsicum chinense]|nr:Protein TRANSPORT INHIBITOR RESPONSE 1 [Capsicum chinense]